MLLKNETRQLWNVKPSPEVTPPPTVTEIVCLDDELKAELRRRMYERIAQGNALADAEDHARRSWHGRDES